MPKKYAIRITENTLDLVTVLNSGVRPRRGEGNNTYFLFAVDSPNTTTDHDVVHMDDLAIYDGNDPDPRIIL
jgi:hypothetical protein